VLRRLRDAGLTIKPGKVIFATQEISFLSHIVYPAGVRVDPDKKSSPNGTLKASPVLWAW
jgi:hypothetical protein